MLAVSMIPDASVFLIVALVLALAFILNRLVFGPVLGIIKQREEAVAAAGGLAVPAAAAALLGGVVFERTPGDPRAEVYRQMDEMRKTALEERAALIDATRREAALALSDARAQLDRDVEAARAKLDADADALAADAAQRILGRQPS